jgi:DNA modification methylase
MNLGPFELNRVLCGNSLEMLKRLPDGCVHVCVTSPPYWGLRDYGLPPSIWDGDSNCRHEFEDLPKISTGPGGSAKQRSLRGSCFTASGGSFCRKCGAWRGCLGLEPTPELYVEHLVKILMEVYRVLRRDGTLWLNLGDSYAGGGGASGHTDKTLNCGRPTRSYGAVATGARKIIGSGLKQKDLVGIPWSVAFALRQEGWYLRSDIIWQKTAPMPESVKDRPTKSHEYIFLLSKTARYFYDAEAIKEPVKDASLKRAGYGWNCDRPSTKNASMGGEGIHTEKMGTRFVNPHGRNKRSVWTVPTKPFKGAHFATFAPALIRPCILAGTSAKGCCPICGAPWKRQLEIVGYDRQRWKPGEDQYHTKAKGKHGKTSSFTTGDVAIKETVGWQPICDCGKDPIPCIVLDPFAGSGTTGIVAHEEGRRFIGFDLNKDYCDKIANPRIAAAQAKLAFFEVKRIAG